MKIENTELRSHLDESMPPPLTGEYVKKGYSRILVGIE